MQSKTPTQSMRCRHCFSKTSKMCLFHFANWKNIHKDAASLYCFLTQKRQDSKCQFYFKGGITGSVRMTVGAWIQCATAGRSIMLLLNLVREWEKTFGVLCFQSIYSTFPLGCSKPKLCFSSNSSHHMDQRKNNSLQLEGLWWGKTSNHTPVLWEESTVQSIKSMQQISKYPVMWKQWNLSHAKFSGHRGYPAAASWWMAVYGFISLWRNNLEGGGKKKRYFPRPSNSIWFQP